VRQVAEEPGHASDQRLVRLERLRQQRHRSRTLSQRGSVGGYSHPARGGVPPPHGRGRLAHGGCSDGGQHLDVLPPHPTHRGLGGRLEGRNPEIAEHRVQE
jgi:hypothetical protein